MADLLTGLIDERIKLKAQAECIAERLKTIDEEIKTEAIPGETFLGSQGYGYVLATQEKKVYSKETIAYLDNKGLLSHFATVSTSKLETLRKKGLLTYPELDAMEATAETKTTYVLRQLIPDDAIVF